MRNLTVDAVILKKHPRGEHDVSVTLYAPTLGRIHATAKGARKIYSNFTGHLDTLNICRIQLYCNGPHYTITQCQAINTHKEIRNDLERSIMALLLLEIVQKTTYSTETGTKLFELIRTTLEHLSKTTKTTLIIETFKIKLLAELGVLPDFAHCTICQKKWQETDHIALQEGGQITCYDCSTTQKQVSVVPFTIAKLGYHLHQQTYETIEKFALTVTEENHLKKLTDFFLHHFLEREIDTHQILLQKARPRIILESTKEA